LSAPRIEITYCTKCKFLLRASWLAQELLSTFEAELAEVSLRPATGGILEISLDGEVLATNRNGGEMQDVALLKRLVRDRIAPAKRIGHD
jgi:selenoprotein W-related protein